MFLEQFAKSFSIEDRQNSELYHLWSSIGVNIEKSILEEQNKLNTELTDINNFSEDTLRSWLAFFLAKVPYRITSTCRITINNGAQSGSVNVPTYTQLKTKEGIIYSTLDQVTQLSAGSTINIRAAQGTVITETGIYSRMIKVQATNPDFTYLKVYQWVNGKKTEIPEVSFVSSYDYLSYVGSWNPSTVSGSGAGKGTPELNNGNGVKGQWYNVVADGYGKFGTNDDTWEFHQGDIVIYNGTNWQKLLKANGINPLQYSNNYVIPSNGYYAYYYDNYLYIKIFSGTDVANPEGKQYEFSYIRSDGTEGQIDENTLSFVGALTNQNGTTNLNITVSNTKSTAAVNQPSTGKLGLILKQRLYCGINVSSVPEYTAWLKAQPEIGDCIVRSDWEKYAQSGYQSYIPTGIVEVLACDNNGDALPDETILELDERLSKYKDIAFVMFSDFTEVYHVLKFTYNSSSQEELFNQFIASEVNKFYNLVYLQSTNGSLFTDLDLGLVIQTILNNSPYDCTGLAIEGYHYKEMTITGTSISITSFEGEEVGEGEYELTLNPGTSSESVHHFAESVSKTNLEYATIYDVNDIQVTVGSRYNNTITFDLSSFAQSGSINGKLKCYWGMKDKGLLSVGSMSGIRKLQSVLVNGTEIVQGN